MEKENVIYKFIEMIKNSWTYEKMTPNEKQACILTLTSNRSIDALKGTYKQRWAILNALYGAYLDGLGYDGGLWRETSEDVGF